MLLERPEEAVVPENVNGMIAARLDTLPVEEKALLQNAAVIGRTFWLGALGRERWELEERLHSLMRKEFVTRNRRSSVAGEDEYVFRHALMREVAYEQIPRAERAARHQSAAEWIESLGRPEDHAEMVAHHYAAALEYARVTGSDDSELATRGRIAFREAGDRAFGLSAFGAATRYYELSLALSSDDDPERAELLLRLGRAHHVSGDEKREQSLEEARAALLAAGRLEEVAETDALLAEVSWYQGDRERCDLLLAQAGDAVAGLAASPAKAHVLSQISRYRMLANEFDEAVRIGEEALAMAEELGLDELRAHALTNIGTSLATLGKAEGIAALEKGVEIGLALRSAQAPRALNNLGAVFSSLGDFRRAGEHFAEAYRVGGELGAMAITRFARAQLAGNLLWAGDWDEGLRHAAACLEDASDEANVLVNVRRNRARILFARDDVASALEDIEVVLAGIRPPSDPQFRVPALGAACRIYLELGREDEARALGAELLDVVLTGPPDWRIIDFSFVADLLGHAGELRRVLEELPSTRWRAVNLALVSGEFASAAEQLDSIGTRFAAAEARLRAAEQLGADGRRTEAREQLDAALAFFREVVATRYIRECEALLADASEVSA
jgi:tetratricopeptide (TPR) repeat protein